MRCGEVFAHIDHARVFHGAGNDVGQHIVFVDAVGTLMRSFYGPPYGPVCTFSPTRGENDVVVLLRLDQPGDLHTRTIHRELGREPKLMRRRRIPPERCQMRVDGGGNTGVNGRRCVVVHVDRRSHGKNFMTLDRTVVHAFTVGGCRSRQAGFLWQYPVRVAPSNTRTRQTRATDL